MRLYLEVFITFAHMTDYLIVGLGLAGIAFAETLERNDKSFKVISDVSQSSSSVAAGMYNPVILKRLTLAWKAKEQLGQVAQFYAGLERKLDVKLNYKIPVLRRFATVGEQNAWFEALDKKGLRDFLSPDIIENKNDFIDAPYGFGCVLNTGRIDTKQLVSKYCTYLLERDRLNCERFDFEDFKVYKDQVEYKSIKAKQIVFAEGYGLNQNPFFNYLPLNGTKGELLTIQATDLKEPNVIKGSVFIIPLEGDLYRVGATYKWKDKSNLPTAEAKEELLEKLRSFLKCDFKVIDHLAGIRPTVVDRMPLVGKHPDHNNLYVLNGLGSRGVMIAPFASEQLFHFIEKRAALDSEIDIMRFEKKFFKG